MPTQVDSKMWFKSEWSGAGQTQYHTSQPQVRYCAGCQSGTVCRPRCKVSYTNTKPLSINWKKTTEALLLSCFQAEHSGGYPVHATVHWQMHSTGWEDCTCPLFWGGYYPATWAAHVLLREFTSFSGWWMLPHEEFIIAEDSLHITMQCQTQFNAALAFLLVSSTAQAKVAQWRLSNQNPGSWIIWPLSYEGK